MEIKSVLMAMTALAITGCSQNEVTEMNPDTNRTIGLDVYTGVQTKGVETTTKTIKEKNAGFGFFAYKTEGTWDEKGSTAKPDFLYNEHGTWTDGESSGSWIYTNIRFWPTNNDNISFFAYAPYESSPEDGSSKGITLSAKTVEGAPTLDFALTTTNNWKDMVDLVTDCRDVIKNLNATNNKGPVSFKFTHVLTKVADIKVKPDQSLGNDIKIYVTELKLISENNTLQDNAKYQFSDNTWTPLSSPSYLPNESDLSDFLDKTAQDNWGYKTESVDVSSNTTPASLFPKDQALYFIPVNNEGGTTNEGDLKLKITYSIVTKVSTTENVTSTTEKTVNLPVGTFKKGTAYTYTLTIKMNAIKIDVEENIENWGVGNDTGINVGE